MKRFLGPDGALPGQLDLLAWANENAGKRSGRSPRSAQSAQRPEITTEVGEDCEAGRRGRCPRQVSAIEPQIIEFADDGTPEVCCPESDTDREAQSPGVQGAAPPAGVSPKIFSQDTATQKGRGLAAPPGPTGSMPIAGVAIEVDRHAPRAPQGSAGSLSNGLGTVCRAHRLRLHSDSGATGR